MKRKSLIIFFLTVLLIAGAPFLIFGYYWWAERPWVYESSDIGDTRLKDEYVAETLSECFPCRETIEQYYGKSGTDFHFIYENVHGEFPIFVLSYTFSIDDGEFDRFLRAMDGMVICDAGGWEYYIKPESLKGLSRKMDDEVFDGCSSGVTYFKYDRHNGVCESRLCLIVDVSANRTDEYLAEDFERMAANMGVTSGK